MVHKPPAWKPLVTKFQIVQFMTSVACFIYTAYLIFALKKPCKGQLGAMWTVFSVAFPGLSVAFRSLSC